MYEILPHTADVRIRVESVTVEGLFEDAAHALYAFSEVESGSDVTETRRMTIESADRTSLLVDFLNDLLARLHVDRLVLARFNSVTIHDTRLDAEAAFVAAQGWSEDVKAVTYHEADVRFEGGLWRTVIVLDI